ncbi:MAG: M48 family metalloprotease [Chloroflexi bacterium]|nr:M48 family metalloprotease [Chloroflexota bacterium]
MFAVIYGVVLLVGSLIGAGSFVVYGLIAVALVVVQYVIGPAMVGWTMKVKYVSEKEEPELHRMVGELAAAAKLPKPKIGVSQIGIPNAFAFGRTTRDGRICVTEGIRRLLRPDELHAVLGHEMSHLKHRDVALMTLLSIFPMIIYYVAMSFIWSGMFGGRDRRGGANPLPLIGIGLLVVHFIVQLMVMYASRLREYHADEGSIRLGATPQHMATALYKLVVGNARAPEAELKRVEGAKAFFVNDPSRALREVRELKEIDQDMSGSIDTGELMVLRSKQVRLSFAEKMVEALGTHPNMLKRIKRLSELG